MATSTKNSRRVGKSSWGILPENRENRPRAENERRRRRWRRGRRKKEREKFRRQLHLNNRRSRQRDIKKQLGRHYQDNLQKFSGTEAHEFSDCKISLNVHQQGWKKDPQSDIIMRFQNVEDKEKILKTSEKKEKSHTKDQDLKCLFSPL